jgi:hypothetical protein
VPVIGSEDLKARFLFGPSQWLRLLGFGALALLIFWLVIAHQSEVLGFVTREGRQHRVLGTAIIMILVPFFAYIYGSFAGYLLRLFRFD